MKYRIKISRADFESLQSHVFSVAPRESGAFMLAGISRGEEFYDVLVRRVLPIAPEGFTEQEEYRLEVSSQVVNGLIALAGAGGLGAVVAHSHPEEIPYSLTDDYGEKRIFASVREFLGNEVPTASLLFTPRGVIGRVWLPEESRPIPFDEILIIGSHIERIAAQESEQPSAEIYDRQVLALGEKGQSQMASTKVAIVGVGGTGSAVAEQLVRLGVADILLIDQDLFEASNLSRIFGSFFEDVSGRPKLKINIIEAHLRRINPGITIKSLGKNIAEAGTALAMRDRDVIFLCTDDHWGRSVVNHIAHQYLIPTINLGTRIDAPQGRITGAMGNIDALLPDGPCLWCKGALDSERIRVESLPEQERESQIREGYIEGISNKAPSVISLNATIAGIAVTHFIQLVTNFGQRPIERMNYFLMENVLQGGRTNKEKCVCQKVRGYGDLKGLPTYKAD